MLGADLGQDIVKQLKQCKRIEGVEGHEVEAAVVGWRVQPVHDVS